MKPFTLGLGVQPSLDWTVPRTEKQIHSFGGMANWFMKGPSEIGNLIASL